MIFYIFRDHCHESPVSHPDPEEWSSQVSRGGERDPAVRDQHQQQQEEEDSAPHWVRCV